MRVTLIAHSFPPAVGGGETLVYLLAKYLTREGINISVVTDSRYKKAKKIGKTINFEFIDSFESFSKGEITEKYFLESVCKTIDKTHPDIVHSFNFYPGYIASIYKRQHNIPHVFTFFNTPLANGKIIKMFDDALIEKSFIEQMVSGMKIDQYVSYSRHTYESGIKLGIKISDSCWCYPGVDNELFKKRGKDFLLRRILSVNDDELLVVVPARIVPRKKIEVLIEAVDIIKKLSFKVIISSGRNSQPGYEWYHKKIIDLIKMKKLEEKIIFPPKLYDIEELGKLYSSSDIGVLSSETEGLGLSILELMNSGVPVIASNTNGINEIVNNEVNGLLFAPGNFRSLSEKMKYLIENPEARKKLAYKAYTTLNNKFSLKSYINYHIGVYKKVYNQL